MLIAAEAPAPAAMHSIAVTAVAASTDPGAISNPTSAVNTTSDITRGLSTIA